jgi:hypothetical protein
MDGVDQAFSPVTLVNECGDVSPTIRFRPRNAYRDVVGKGQKDRDRLCEPKRKRPRRIFESWGVARTASYLRSCFFRPVNFLLAI